MAKKLGRTKVNKAKLGSGIHAIFSQKEINQDPERVVKELSNTFAQIPIEQVESNPDQPRKEFDEDALKELSESIKVHGLIQPITVRMLSPKEYQLISGERRWRASKLAGLEEIPAYIRIANDQEMLEMALIENIQRENLNAVEVAISYHRLKDEFNLTDERLAERVGKKRSTITNYLGILELHPSAIEAVKKEIISLGHAKAIKGLKDKLLQNMVLEEIIKKRLSVRRTEKLVQSYQKGKTETKPKESVSRLPKEYQDIRNDFRSFFGSGRIKLELQKDGQGQIVIPFKDANELTEFFKCIEQ